MIKQSHEYFKKIYFVDNPEVLTEDQMENFIMVSTKNWNYYFSDLGKKIKKNIIFKQLSSVELVEFDSDDNMWNFYEKLDKKLLIDFSLEHDNPCILKFAK